MVDTIDSQLYENDRSIFKCVSSIHWSCPPGKSLIISYISISATRGVGWTHLIWKDWQFLLHQWYQSCYSTTTRPSSNMEIVNKNMNPLLMNVNTNRSSFYAKMVADITTLNHTSIGFSCYLENMNNTNPRCEAKVQTQVLQKRKQFLLHYWLLCYFCEKSYDK